MPILVDVLCENTSCNKNFKKKKYEYDRSIKNKSKQFCSHKCMHEGRVTNKMIDVICENPTCGKSFKKTEYYYNKYASHTCSRQCTIELLATKPRTKEQLKSALKNISGTTNPKAGYRKHDEISFGLKYLMTLAEQRHKKKHQKNKMLFDIDLEYLKEVWNKQNICPYSKIQLVLPMPYRSWRKTKNDSIISASLDRIDSSIGYVKGNVQFVARPINFLKGTLSHDETINFCKTITKNLIATV